MGAGLHVSPNQDDVSLAIYPGQHHKYTYTLGANHLPGLLWCV